MAFSGVHLPSWDADKEIFMILAIKDQFTTTTQHNLNDNEQEQYALQNMENNNRKY